MIVVDFRPGRVITVPFFSCISCTSNDTWAPPCRIGETEATRAYFFFFTVDVHQSACSIKMIKCYEFPKKPFVCRIGKNCEMTAFSCIIYNLFHFLCIVLCVSFCFTPRLKIDCKYTNRFQALKCINNLHFFTKVRSVYLDLVFFKTGIEKAKTKSTNML